MCTLDASGFQKSQESTVLGGRDRRGPTGRMHALPVLPRRPKVYRRNCPVSYFLWSWPHIGALRAGRSRPKWAGWSSKASKVVPFRYSLFAIWFRRTPAPPEIVPAPCRGRSGQSAGPAVVPSPQHPASARRGRRGNAMAGHAPAAIAPGSGCPPRLRPRSRTQPAPPDDGPPGSTGSACARLPDRRSPGLPTPAESG